MSRRESSQIKASRIIPYGAEIWHRFHDTEKSLVRGNPLYREIPCKGKCAARRPGALGLRQRGARLQVAPACAALSGRRQGRSTLSLSLSLSCMHARMHAETHSRVHGFARARLEWSHPVCESVAQGCVKIKRVFPPIGPHDISVLVELTFRTPALSSNRCAAPEKLVYLILYYTIIYYTILYYTIILYYNTILLYYGILYCEQSTIPYHTIPYHTILYYTIPYHTIPYYTILYYTTLPYTTL